ncbi:phosphopantetheine-binding protein [Streptomyces sp. NPDC058700]|uniref:phosphopantetheine-binding protein n=1 Tax=unclassified Streptomyces TaxID=2593676 RepID=UPI0036674831
MTNSVEETATRIWTDILRPAAGQEEHTFFALGGQSISAVRIVARVESDLGAELDIRVLFEDPDLAAFRQAVGEAVDAAAESSAA